MLANLRKRFSPKQKRPYQLFQIEPSLQCNLRCVMCPWRELRASAGVMSWETFECIRPYLPLAREVDFTGGGEPTHNPCLLDMVWTAKAAGCRVGFSTNGMRLSPEMSADLVAADLDWISFSVDAATAEVYQRIRQGASFETVIANIAGLSACKAGSGRKKPQLMMVFVMMGGPDSATENYHQLPDYVELAHRLGVERVIAKNLDVILQAGDDAHRLFSHSGPPRSEVQAAMLGARQRAKALGVGFRIYGMRPQEQAICEHNPLQSLYFNWEGTVSPCITLAYAEARIFDGQPVQVPCQRFGDIHAESLEEIWEKPAYREFRQMFTARQRAERAEVFNALVGSGPDNDLQMPPAPLGCRTCYYLYGI